MEELYKVSIIMPVYCVDEEFLCKSIESACEQSYKNIEIIVVDDGSPDNSGKIADTYIEKDKRIHVVHTLNRGVSAARNTGLSISTGDFVFFLDSDDWLEPNAIERMVKYAIEYVADLICVNNFYNESHNETKRHNIENAPRVYSKTELNRLKLSAITPEYELRLYNAHIGMVRGVWGKLYRIQPIKDNNIIFSENLKIGEDANFNICYLNYIDSAVFINEYLYHYRVVENSANRRFRKDIIDIRLNLLKAYWLNSDKDEEYFSTCFSREILSCVMNCLQKYFCNRQCEGSSIEKVKGIKVLLNNEWVMKLNYFEVKKNFFTIYENILIFFVKHKNALILYLLGCAMSLFGK